MKIASFSYQYLEAYIMCRSTRTKYGTITSFYILKCCKGIYMSFFFMCFVWVHTVHYRFRFIFLTSSGSITGHYSGIKPTMIVLERAAEIKPFLSNFSFYEKKNSMLACRVICCSHQSDRRIWVCISHQSDCRIGVCIAPIRLPH